RPRGAANPIPVAKSRHRRRKTEQMITLPQTPPCPAVARAATEQMATLPTKDRPRAGRGVNVSGTERPDPPVTAELGQADQQTLTIFLRLHKYLHNLSWQSRNQTG